MKNRFWKALGPGLVLAGTSIGSSHLVQSTRAGALFGITLISVVLLANAMKYPAFSFAPLYVSVKGENLLHNYKKQGPLAMGLYIAATLFTVFTATAGVTMVSSGLLIALFRLEITAMHGCYWVLGLCLFLTFIGGFKWLDRVMKASLLLLSIGTLVATCAALPQVSFTGNLWPTWAQVSVPKTFLFVVALIGWMPAPIDLSVWHSIWSMAKRKETKYAATVKESKLDFDIGYVGCAVLGVCFVLLGAGVMSQGKSLPTSAIKFSAGIIDIYAQTLGAWARPVLGSSAFLVMFSTTLAIVDGAPRAALAAVDTFWGRNVESKKPFNRRGLGFLFAIIIDVGAVFILLKYATSLPKMIDLATTTGVVTAPLFGVLNHRAVFGFGFPKENQPSKTMKIASLVCIVLMGLLAFAYGWLRIAWILGST